MFHHWRGITWISHIKCTDRLRAQNATLTFQSFNVTQCNATTSKLGSLSLSPDQELDLIVNPSRTPSSGPKPATGVRIRVQHGCTGPNSSQIPTLCFSLREIRVRFWWNPYTNKEKH